MRGRELWRRNRQGTLPSPAWWPADLAPLFWPALTLLLVAVLASVLTLLVRVWPHAPNPVESAAPVAAVEDASPPLPGLTPISEPPAVAPPLEEIVQERAEEDTPELDASALEDSEPVAPEGLEGPFAPDPLLELVQRPEADGLLLQAEGVPEQSLLILQVRPAFPALSPQEQRRRAELWQQWALELGYDHLELRDSRAGLIARDALVGEGMIVLRDSSST